MSRAGHLDRYAPSNHGTDSSYSRGCRCEACRQAHNAAARRRRMSIYHLESAEPYAEWLRRMTEPVMTLSDVSRRTGLSMDTLREIRDGSRGKVQNTTAAKLRPWMEAAS